MARQQQHPYAMEAVRLLGTQIAIARRERGISEAKLSERLGITRPTLRRIERGEPSVAIGTVFDAAAVLAVPLFHEDSGRVALELSRATDALRLLPDRVRSTQQEVHDDF